MARIAVGGFQHETNTFAPQQATWEEFVRADAWPPLLRGPEMIAGVEGFNIPIAGAVKRLAELGHEVVPLAWAAARAGLLRHRGCLREDVGAVRRGHRASSGRSTPSTSTCTAPWWRRTPRTAKASS